MGAAASARVRVTGVQEVAPVLPWRASPDLAADERQADAVAARVILGAAASTTHRATPPTVRPPLRDGGAPLDAAARAFFEPRLGTDLGGVRVHHGPAAAASARAHAARAYAFGNHIVFGAGEYRPRSAEGRTLIAHELAHLRQDAVAGGSPVLRRKPCPGCHEGGHRPSGVQDVTLEELDDSASHYLAPVNAAQDAFAFLRAGMSWMKYEGCPRRRVQAIHAHAHDGSSQIVGYLLEFTNPKGSNFTRPVVTLDAYGGFVDVSWVDPQAIESVMSPVDFIGPGVLTRPFVAGARAVGRTATRLAGEAMGVARAGARKVVLSARLAGVGAYEALPAVSMNVGRAADSALVTRGGAAFGTTLPTGGAPMMTAAQAEAWMGAGATGTTAAARVAGPSMADVGQAVGAGVPGAVTHGSTAAAATAALGSGLATPSRPGLQTHSTAPGVRAAYGVSGATHQSAHLVPQAVYRALARAGAPVSPNRAVTINLPIAAHRALDAGWVAAWNMAVGSGRQVTALMVYEWVKAAILAVDPSLMSEHLKGMLVDRLRTELFVDLGLDPGTVIVP